MRIEFDNFIDGLEHQIPDIEPGQLHLVVVEQLEWLSRLVWHVCAQQSLLYMVESHLPEDHRLDLSSCRKGSDIAEWKPANHYTHEGFGRALSSLGNSYDVICMQFSTQSNSALLEFMLNQGGLLTARRWARNQQKILLVILDGDKDEPQLRSFLAANACHCHSSSSIYQGQPYWRWDISHWFDGAHVIQRNLRLEAQPEGRFAVIEDPSANTENYSLQSEQAPVYYVNGALDGSDVAPIEWYMLDQSDEWLDHLTPMSDDALIIGYFRGQTMQRLLRDVYEVRKVCGPYVRLYIRERDQAIRHHDERLLMQAGATMVLPFGLRFSQVVSLVENSVDWRYNRRLPEHFDELTDQLVPEHLQGYLPAHDFAEQIVFLSQLAERQGVDFTLVRAKPSSGMTCVDVLKAFKHRREGDLSSSDGHWVYFFLFACRAADADRALTFLFGLPVQTLLREEERMHSVYLMQTTRDQLLSKPRLPDFNEQLQLVDGTVERDSEAYDRFFPSPRPAKPARLQ